MPRELPGLELMKDRTPDGACPFCLDPLPRGRRRHCGAPECQTAYMRTYQRDRRAGNLVRLQRVAAPAPSGRGWQANSRRSAENSTRLRAVRSVKR